MPVEGIGGVFVRSKDPDALARWYREHLGVGAGCAAPGLAAEEWVWMTNGGPVVFAPFPLDSDYFPADRSFMLNLRVSDLASLLESLRAAGIAVVTNPDWDQPGLGLFARIHDPEGNPIELWEPPT